LRDAPVSAFAVVKNEQFYIRSFLDHHRRLGVEQFVIIDDRSSDGTAEFLAAQPDVVLLESPHSYGEEIVLAGPSGERRLRAGIAFKTLIPRRFLAGRYAICLDADEYLVLPPDIDSLPQLVDLLARHDVVSVAASLVDFFPATLAEMQQPREFPTGPAMLGGHGWFDAVPLLDWLPGKPGPQQVNDNASTRLFRKHRVKAVPKAMLGAPAWLNRWLPYQYPYTSVSKMPIVRWDEGVEYMNSHKTNVAPSDRVLVGLAHVKFTYDLARRTEYALRSKAYVRSSRKYQWYEDLLDSMRRNDPSFLGPNSRRFETAADFAAAGLTKLDLA
jgi:hypothetical protein